MTLDSQIRLAAFDWLVEQVRLNNDVLPRKLLEHGFDFRGKRIPLVSPKGIFKPRQMEYPLSITTTPRSIYKDDPFSKNGLIEYKYRGTDPGHPDNVGLRDTMKKRIPIIYLFGIVPGKYLAEWPAYVVDDDPNGLSFSVAIDSEIIIDQPDNLIQDNSARRAYITSTVKTRLHQKGFRERVIAAYQSQCAFCRLKHAELLDAAHIIPDEEENSQPTVDNGLALCKIHHAAFDHYIIGVTPDYEIKVREDILREIDGPMLQHGLQELHNHKLILPRSKNLRPNRDYLDWRYERFRKAI
jgi:putative restriction endonuclease